MARKGQRARVMVWIVVTDGHVEIAEQLAAVLKIEGLGMTPGIHQAASNLGAPERII
jgi:hypothetical protein